LKAKSSARSRKSNPYSSAGFQPAFFMALFALGVEIVVNAHLLPPFPKGEGAITSAGASINAQRPTRTAPFLYPAGKDYRRV